MHLNIFILPEKPLHKMIITLAGTAGSGKSTVAKLVAKKLNLKHHSTGDFMRSIAEQRKISLLELSKLAEKDQSIDEELDQRQVELGRSEDNFIIDGRLSFHFIPNSKKFFLTADFDTRAKRILADNIRKEHNINIETTKQNMRAREESEKKRYKVYYNLDTNDPSNYNLVIDTTDISAKEAAEKIIKFIENSI